MLILPRKNLKLVGKISQCASKSKGKYLKKSGITDKNREIPEKTTPRMQHP
jgi:hypothetical protein